MKLRSLEPEYKNYSWESEKPQYAIVFNEQSVIAVFDNIYWANKFVSEMSSGYLCTIKEIVY